MKPDARSRRRHPPEVSLSILEAAKTLSASELVASFGIAERTAHGYVAKARQQEEVSQPKPKEKVKEPSKPLPRARKKISPEDLCQEPSIKQLPKELNPEQLLANNTLIFVVSNDVVLSLLKNALQS